MQSNPERPDSSNPYSTPRSGVVREGGPAPLASLVQRFGGAFTDGALMWACLLGPAMIAGDLGAMFDAMGSGDPNQVQEAIAGGNYTATPILILVLGVFNMVLLYRDGQTIGKRLLGTRIVRTSGERAGFFRIICLRAWAPSLFYMIPLAGAMVMVLGHAAILLRPRRCFHDYLADTKVVVA